MSDSLLNPMDYSTPGFRVLHYLPELQTHVHWVSDVIQSSHHLLPPSPLGLNLSQHQGLLQKTLLIYCPHFSYVHFFLTMWGSWVIRCTPWGRASWVRSPGQPRPLAPGERSTSYLAAALPTNCVSQTEATPTRCWWHGKQQRRMQEKHFSLIHDIITTECSFLTYPEFHGGVKFVRTEDLNTCVHFVRI